MKTASEYRRHFVDSIVNLTGGSPGFTLLEVMISVSIVAVIFVSVFRMQSASVNLALQGKFNTLAPVLASRLLSDIEADLENWSASEGHFETPYEEVAWTCEILDLENIDTEIVSEAFQESLKKIEITIVDPSLDSRYSVSTWRFVHE